MNILNNTTQTFEHNTTELHRKMQDKSALQEQISSR